MKKVLVTGSSGFIGGHLVKLLKNKGCFVIGADIVQPQYEKPHLFYNYDLCNNGLCRRIFTENHRIEEVYNLCCLMGGMSFIGDYKYAYDIMVGSSLMITNIIECSVEWKVKKIFYSSSACVYNENYQKDTFGCSLKEEYAIPAQPDLVYGWQKLFGEMLHTSATIKGVEVRIARFHNIFGIEGTWDGGKEKYPAAICRKIALAKDGDTISIFGDGNQTRSYLNVDECLKTLMLLMNSNITEPLNIGSDELISCNDLAKMVIEISGKKLTIEHDLTKPQGVRGRNSDNTKIKQLLGYAPQQDLKAEMTKLYNWISKQVANGK